MTTKSSVLLLLACSIPSAFAQEKPVSPPRLVTYWGTATAADGKPKIGVAGVTFSLYEENQGGAPLWMETQNVALDSAGGYTAQIGATHPDGLPIALFANGQARWLEIQVDGQPAGPRVLLMSVPYALKAVDAQTLGGLPASAFALAGSAGRAETPAIAAPAAVAESAKTAPAAVAPSLTGAGTTGYVPIWTNGSTLGNSLIYQTNGNVGIVATSSAKLTVQNPSQTAILGTTASSASIGVQGQATATIGGGNGVAGITSGTAGAGVLGEASNTSGNSWGVLGKAAGSSGTGVQGEALSTTGTTYGVQGNSASPAGTGVQGTASSTTGDTAGVVGSVSSVTGRAIEGDSGATAGISYGVIGFAASDTGVGVYGQATATSGVNYGVSGLSASSNGVGVYGVGITGSDLGGGLAGNSAGVWGDTKNGSAGVFATADGTEAIAAYNSATNVATLFVENQEDTNSNSIVLATFSSYGGYCDVFVNGNLTCSGSVGGHAVVADGAKGNRDVALYAMQSPENWFEDAGSGQLHNGAALVALDPQYAQTVNTGMDYHVFLTPNGDCKGLYVTQKSPTSFEVHELGGGNSTVAFDYRIMARRKGFENVRMADITGQIQTGTNVKPRHASPLKRPVAAPSRAARVAAHAPEPQAGIVAVASKTGK